MRTLKELQANLKEGYEIVNFGSARPHSYRVWVVKEKELILPKRLQYHFSFKNVLKRA